MLLRNKDRNRLLKIANEEFKTPIKIWAYGSRVTGRAHDCSDLDLAIRTPNRDELFVEELDNFKQRLTDSNIPFFVDVMDWGIIPDSFKENILKNYHSLREDF